jgi:hypothetical protein
VAAPGDRERMEAARAAAQRSAGQVLAALQGARSCAEA